MENKTLNIIKLVILGVIAVLLISILVYLLKGGSNFEGIVINGKSKLIYDKEFTAEVENVNVSTINNDVKIEESENEKIRVKIYDEEQVEPEVYVEENTLIIKNKNKEKVVGIVNLNNNPKIVISVPKNKLYNLNVDGKSSDIQSNLDLGNVTIITTSGDIDLKNTNDLSIESNSGDIEILNTKNLKIKTTSGDIDISKISSKVNIKTISGDININELDLTNNSKITATSGDIIIGKTNDIYIDTEVTSGDVKVNKNNRHAKCELEVKTTSGDILVRN